MPAKKPSKLKPAELRAALQTDLAACWHHARQLHPDHVPYAFVLYGVEDTPHLSPHVLTEESLNQVAQRYIAEGHHETLDEARQELRYSVADSPLFSELQDMLPSVDALMAPHEHALDETAGYALLAKAAMEAFEALDKNGLFGKNQQRERLLLAIMTEDAEKDWTLPSVKRLNPPNTFKRFKAETNSDAVFASCDALAISSDGKLLFSSESRELDARRQKWLHEIVAYDISGLQLKRRWSLPFPMGYLKVSCVSDGTVLALRSEYSGGKIKTTLVRFNQTGNTLIQESVLRGEPSSFTVSLDGSRIAIAMRDKTIQFLDANFRVIEVLTPKSPPMGISFLKSGDLLFATDAGVFRITAGYAISPTSFTSKAFKITIDRDEKLAAVSRWFSSLGPENEQNAEFGFTIVSLPTLNHVKSFSIPGHQLVKATLSSDGQLVAFEAHEIGTYRKFVAILNVATGKEIARRKSQFIDALAFFPGDKVLALAEGSSAKPKPVLLWPVPAVCS